MWQDYVIMVVNLSFIFALLPSVFSESKPHRGTCILTGVGLTVLTVVFATLSLTFSAITAGLTAFLWFVLFIQTRL